MTNNNIKLDNVSIDYNGKIILQNINFEFNNKGIYTLMGPNGSGKTTLLKAISGQKKIQKVILVISTILILVMFLIQHLYMNI